ncbi:xanthine dehydrogenase family protein (plasmid) [Paroceanicella profunda]|uniref:Xanthine dehydrogenase family protein n=1 Tax=Paroceanicella profunda TaxID=2579971 RepID=A0A5B8G1X7_9RHOB|nr:xanthine dehydrogenase family protein molybdopterin-binding subunit [Paroceanicella profunda]QDL94675.1 xanthine dehydrogenase family protein [Paroceanicella profunda]
MPADRTLIGASAPRASARRTVEGLGRYTDDLDAAGAAHVAFLRSPHAHARILATELDEARAAPGVTGVYTAQHLAAVCGPWQTRLAALPRHVSPPQQALAGEIVRYQGEPVVAVLAESRRAAESALELAWVEFEDLDPAILPPDIFEPGFDPAAWEPQQALDRSIAYGDAAAALAGAAHVVRHRFSFGRQTAVSLEGRAVDAGFDRRTGRLTVHQSHQAPFQMQQIYADLFGLPLGRVQVIAPDVGGAFGGKLHALPDEIAAVALAVLTGRRVKFTADRLESFLADAHAREAQAEARLGVDAEGRILGLEIEFAAGLGAYSIYPRGSVGDALQAIQLAPAAYRVPHYAARARAWFQNKAPVGAYRGVGQPIAFAIMEQMLDMAAAACGLDPAEMRRRNYRAAPETPGPTETGVVLESLTTRACLDMLLAEMDYAGLRAEQAALRAEGVYRGIGLTTFVELTGVGAQLYGPQQVRVAAQETCRLSLEPDGSLTCRTSVTDQGQGTLGGLAQIVAETLGVAPEAVEMIAGDTGATPVGGGAWASRGMALGGEAALRAARGLAGRLRAVAAPLLQCPEEALRFAQGGLEGPGGARISFREIAETVAFRPYLLPGGTAPALEVTESFLPPDLPYLATNGVLAAHVEVEAETGLTRVLGFWAVDDCGRIVNPMLVDGQIRGGVVQGIGAALFEECRYSADGQLTNGSLVDYRVPMAADMPDIVVRHIETPTRQSLLGAKGVGEAGTVGALGAMWCAVNDALAPLGASVRRQPFTPEHVLSRIHGLEEDFD